MPQTAHMWEVLPGESDRVMVPNVMIETDTPCRLCSQKGFLLGEGKWKKGWKGGVRPASGDRSCGREERDRGKER